MSCSINKLKSHLFFTCKNFMFYDFKWKKGFVPWNGEGGGCWEGTDEKSISGNWNAEETSLFCEIAADPITNFMISLEQKALKKSSTKKVFEKILDKFQEKCWVKI